MRWILKVLAVVLIAVLLVGCRTSGNDIVETISGQLSSQEVKATLVISAAASLKDAMEDIKQIYTEENPNVTLTYNFGSSGSLQQQIEQGAPADIFLSAATKQMNALKEKGLILEETHKDLLENKVVLITSTGNSQVIGFESLSDVLVKKIALGEPNSVPAGQYAEEVLNNLNVKEVILPKAVYAKDVREVLAWVETENVDAGMVYETDAKISDKVKIVATAPEGSHKPIIYPVAVIKDSKNTDVAKTFIEFLSTEKVKSIFEKYGFNVI
ncbi:molybdate ABC transporter substrate-binding protein [Clostridium formicaceticum]|uniref:Molybdate ABC transporter substrate-binding protein n=1 Tax=Clostridium formicaceticum TaxID=1497 RepID=A0AAC9RHE1_9CLOT|nr:molybdate ABC transporter substrate-binding protein [Clostridium formicaceticum]AOY76599.1 molybdate ABC transporter substrate-binding protein [Clostridium formicaceticum]ARE87019.1 Molybdate-binding periplasmic protein precursor [Clostridium formicaceticum]